MNEINRPGSVVVVCVCVCVEVESPDSLANLMVGPDTSRLHYTINSINVTVNPVIIIHYS